MDWLAKIAPTVLSALGSPLAGSVVSLIGEAIGMQGETQEKIKQALTGNELTAEQLTKLKELELILQEQERERGFRYAELTIEDRKSARQASVDGGTMKHVFWMSVGILSAALGTDVYILVFGLPEGLDEMVVGKAVGFLENVAMMVIGYWFGTSFGSQQKTEIMAKK